MAIQLIKQPVNIKTHANTTSYLYLMYKYNISRVSDANNVLIEWQRLSNNLFGDFQSFLGDRKCLSQNILYRVYSILLPKEV